MGFVIAYDRNQPRNQGRDGKFWLEYSKSYQPDSTRVVGCGGHTV